MKKRRGSNWRKNSSLVSEQECNEMIKGHDPMSWSLTWTAWSWYHSMREGGVSAEPSGDINQKPPSSESLSLSFLCRVESRYPWTSGWQDKFFSIFSPHRKHDQRDHPFVLSLLLSNKRKTDLFHEKSSPCTESLSTTINLRFSLGVCFVIDFSNSFVTSTIEDELDDRDLFSVFVLEGIFNGYLSPLSLLRHREDLSWINVFTIQRLRWEFLSLQTKERIMECPPSFTSRSFVFVLTFQAQIFYGCVFQT